MKKLIWNLQQRGDDLSREAARELAQIAAYGEKQSHIINAANQRIADLEKGLREAIASIEEWGAYADEYFQKKWDLAGDIARLKALLQEES
ncbi:hypothetical protein ACRYJU_07205 [Alloalcanivorax xenomutans]|uniref:hypothetical protein n=1 Tax=Alloalcanivorax xenomutans TaxID=1094342 RepID=UPI003D9B526C